MGLASMTGYGRGEASAHGMKVEVELSSVNRKQFDVRMSLPRTLSALESRMYALVHDKVSRGFITGSVKFSLSGSSLQKSVSLDTDLAKVYVRKIRGAAKNLGVELDLTAESLLRLPGVVRQESVPESTAEMWPLTRKALGAAVTRLVEMRKMEGKALQSDLKKKFAKVKCKLAAISRLAPRVTRNYRNLLTKRLRKAGLETQHSEQRIAVEIALFADKSDIGEEIVRLESHFSQAVGLLAAPREPVGRALDFLCQEMFREINTIGSKANDVAISGLVVEFKTLLECIREQVQNVE
jgi:uncharacterized protein (TIGR00255 family)